MGDRTGESSSSSRSRNSSTNSTEIQVRQGDNEEIVPTTSKDLVLGDSDLKRWIARQEYINKSYDKLAKFNFALTYANIVKTSQVERKCEGLAEDVAGLENTVDGVKRSVKRQSEAMNNLEGDFDSMQGRIEEHRKRVDELRDMANGQQTEVKSVLESLSSRVRKQQATIEAQERLVAKLGDTKLKQDAIVDICAVVVSVVFSGSPIVDWPLQIVSAMIRTVVTGRRGRKNLSQIVSVLRFIAFVACVRWIRQAAARSGIHSFVGGPATYAALAYELLVSKYQAIRKEVASRKVGRGDSLATGGGR